MNVDREQRYPTARALADALAPFCGAAVAGPAVRTSSAPPRFVIRPSSAPPASADAAVAPATTGAVVTRTTATGFADTLHTDPPQKPAGRSRVMAFVGVLMILVAAGLTWTFVRSARSPVSAAVTVAATADPERSAPPPASSVVGTVDTSVAAMEDAGASRSGATVRLAPPSVHTVLSAGVPSVAASAPPIAQPAAPSPARTRVDQTGLAGENPFR
jgi:hypothetical protein